MILDKNKEFQLGQWLVTPLQNSVTKGGESKIIEPQCMALLIFLVEKQGQVVTREQLLEALWQDVVVNENTLTKTVAMLRNALEDDRKQPKYIITRFKKGYQLIADVSMNKPDVSHSTHGTFRKKSSKSNAFLSRPIFWQSGLLLLIVLAFFIWLVGSTRDNGPSFKRFTPITSSRGIERDPKFSPDGLFVVYSERSEDNSGFDLAIYSLSEKISQTLSRMNGDELAPAWSPDGKRLAYFNKRDGKCGLYVTYINYPNLIEQGEMLVTCGNNNEGQIHWLDDDLILYSDRNINTMGQHKLYRVKISTKYIKEVEGHYPFEFAVSPDRQQIALLEQSSDSFNLEVNQFSFKSKKTLPWLSGLSSFSDVTWFSDNQRLLISDIYQGKLDIVNMAGDRQSLFQSNVMLGQPTLSPDDKIIALVQSTIQANVYETGNPLFQSKDATEKEITPLVASNYHDYMHEYSHDGHKSGFISNRNGQHQLWIQDSGKEHSIELGFIGDSELLDFHWSPDDYRILIMLTNGQIWIYSLDDDSALRLNIGHNRIFYPVWDNNSDAVLFSRFDDMGPQLWEFDLVTKTQRKINRAGAVSSTVSPDGRYLYVLKTVPGLWQINRKTGEELQLLDKIDTSAWGSLVAFNDGVYWREDIKTGYLIRHFDTNNDQATTVLTVSQTININIRYFDVSSDQQSISFYRMFDYESDLVLLRE